MLVAHARGYGRRAARWCLLPIVACAVAALYSWWIAAALYVIAMVLLLPPLMRAECERIRVLLSATKWARAHGIQPETLRLFSWGR